MQVLTPALAATAPRADLAQLSPHIDARQGFTRLVIGVSTGALFDTRAADAIYTDHGEAAYRAHLFSAAQQPFASGAAFPLVQKLLRLNKLHGVEVQLVMLSRSTPEIADRVALSIAEHGLLPEGSRKKIMAGAAYTGGEPVTPALLTDYKVDLLLSRHADDVQAALAAGKAAALVPATPDRKLETPRDIVLAFDFDDAQPRADGRQAEWREARDELVLRRALRGSKPHLLTYLGAGGSVEAQPAPGTLKSTLGKFTHLRNFLSLAQPQGAQIRLMVVTAHALSLLPAINNAFAQLGGATDKLYAVPEKADGQRALPQADLFIDDGVRQPGAPPLVKAAAWLPWQENTLRDDRPLRLQPAPVLQLVRPNRPAANGDHYPKDEPRQG